MPNRYTTDEIVSAIAFFLILLAIAGLAVYSFVFEPTMEVPY